MRCVVFKDIESFGSRWRASIGRVVCGGCSFFWAFWRKERCPFWKGGLSVSTEKLRDAVFATRSDKGDCKCCPEWPLEKDFEGSVCGSRRNQQDYGYVLFLSALQKERCCRLLTTFSNNVFDCTYVARHPHDLQWSISGFSRRVGYVFVHIYHIPISVSRQIWYGLHSYDRSATDQPKWHFIFAFLFQGRTYYLLSLRSARAFPHRGRIRKNTTVCNSCSWWYWEWSCCCACWKRKACKGARNPSGGSNSESLSRKDSGTWWRPSLGPRWGIWNMSYLSTTQIKRGPLFYSSTAGSGSGSTSPSCPGFLHYCWSFTSRQPNTLFSRRWRQSIWPGCNRDETKRFFTFHQYNISHFGWWRSKLVLLQSGWLCWGATSPDSCLGK